MPRDGTSPEGERSFAGERMHHPPRTAPPVDRVSRIYDQAARYGALSSEHGQVTITTRRDGEQIVVDLVDKEGRLELAPPRSGGSGPELAKLSIERELGGSIEKDGTRRVSTSG